MIYSQIRPENLQQGWGSGFFGAPGSAFLKSVGFGSVKGVFGSYSTEFRNNHHELFVSFKGDLKHSGNIDF